MEQILPVLERQLRQFRRNSASLAARHPRLARYLGLAGAAPDAHVDRLLQGVASLHARTALALQRAGWQRDEHLLEALHPQHLRPFPACRIGPGPGVPPVFIRAARFCTDVGAASPAIEIDVEWAAERAARSVDIYIEGDASYSAVLRAALLTDAVDATGARPFAPCGLAPEEALLPRPPGGHAGLALLREFFVCPQRFNFVRLDLAPFAGVAHWTIRVPLSGMQADGPAARLLAGLEASHLRAGWTASAGLFANAAAPIRLDGRQAEYPVSVASDSEIFSIDRVRVGQGTADWVARYASGAAPGHEWRIAFKGHFPADAVVSINVSCCRRADVLARPARGQAARWQLNSLLALDMLPQSAAALRELMATQAINGSPASQAMIGAVLNLAAHPALLWSGRGAPLAGTELRLQIDEGPFAGCGLMLFVQVMDRFFGECAHLNTFTRLVLVSARTGEELIRCKARNAGTLLE